MTILHEKGGVVCITLSYVHTVVCTTLPMHTRVVLRYRLDISPLPVPTVNDIPMVMAKHIC